MEVNNVDRLKVWRADAEWDDDVEVVRASDYDQLRAENERLRQDIESYNAHREKDSYPLCPDGSRAVYGVDYGDPDCPKPKPFFTLVKGKQSS